MMVVEIERATGSRSWRAADLWIIRSNHGRDSAGHHYSPLKLEGARHRRLYQPLSNRSSFLAWSMDVSAVRAHIKSWERDFKAEHGRGPSVQDIKEQPAIGKCPGFAITT